MELLVLYKLKENYNNKNKIGDRCSWKLKININNSSTKNNNNNL